MVHNLSLKVPGKTRIAGTCIMLKCIENQIALLETVLMPESAGIVPSEVKSLILRDDFWEELSVCKNILEPIAQAITVSEGDNARLHHVPLMYGNIKSKLYEALSSEAASTLLSSYDITCVKNALSNRNRTKFCCKVIRKAAHLLNPHFQGKGLTDGEVMKCLELFKVLAEHLELDDLSIVVNLGEFRTRTGFFSNNALWRISADLSPSVMYTTIRPPCSRPSRCT